MSALKVCLLSSEIVPYAKTGGLADVAGALVRNLGGIGHDVRAFMPLYPVVRRNCRGLQPVPGAQRVKLAIGATEYGFSLMSADYPGSDSPVYFVDCPALFDRGGLYTNDADEHRRFLLFTRAALDGCRLLGFAADIFHCNDWHTAFLPLYLKTLYRTDALFAHAKSLLTIHNIGYQGLLPASAAADLDLGGAAPASLDQGDIGRGVINALKTGIRHADRVSTVSPTYAREICDTPLGMGLQGTLLGRADRVAGILNGVDYQEWDPRLDPHLSAHFTPQDLRGKLINKEMLIATLQLRITASQPLLGMVTRLTEQKGIDILFDALPALLDAREFGLAVLGSGDPRYVAFFEDLARRFPGRVSYRSGFDEPLAHLIEAGSDVFLMPSRYEPCGLNQMYSLRYGTIPVVRNTGGLADSVQHFDPGSGRGTGCVFNDYDSPAVSWAINTVLDWYAEPRRWLPLMQNAMAMDFSWTRQIREYDSLYQGLRKG
ncbi:MAG TPA: glycogen/starch synthase [Steroidobacteraceae bacterium]|jgi:starch synthase|nr:glycogen/starch synthase [Steroidobacteraceae bacterium]